MEKMKLPLREFLTLIGPAAVIEVRSEKEEGGSDSRTAAPLFRGKRAKIRDHEELLEREVKMIEAKLKVEPYYITYFEIWIF